MLVHLLLHLERADDGEHVWWAESDDVPGYSAAAESLVELRDQVRRALPEILGEEVTVRERLAAPEGET